mgnify:CR=1 FL=1
MHEVVIPIVTAPDVEAPTYATSGAAGMDIRASEAVEVPSLGRAMVPTGIRVAIPEGYEIQVRPRSGLSIMHGITLINPPGAIDSDFRGEVNILVVNLGDKTYTIKQGERIAQLVVCPVTRATWLQVNHLSETERGEGGFGSTGER